MTTTSGRPSKPRTTLDTITTFRGCAKVDLQTASVDPLNCDAFFACSFSRLNGIADRSGLLSAAQLFALRATSMRSPSKVEALATIRDLGMICASLTKHELCPANVPGLTEALLKMSRIADEIPRETLFSYGPRNPEGKRVRTFTGLSEEELFIHSFSKGVSVVARSIELLLQAQAVGPSGRNAPDMIGEAAHHLRTLVQLVVEVRKGIPASTFTHAIRPYLQPYQVGPKQYVAPGGGQLPVFLIDMLTWTSGPRSVLLHQYIRDNVAYLPRMYRELTDDLEGVPSLLSRCIAAVRNHDASTVVVRCLVALDLLLTSLVQFRFPHKRLTEENLRLKSYGTYQWQILSRLLDQTVRARTRVRRVLQQQRVMTTT